MDNFMRALISILALAIGLDVAPRTTPGIVAETALAPAAAPVAAAPVRTQPAVRTIGGGPAEQALVEAAVEAFEEHGLALPDLEVRFHDSSEGCNGHQGRFREIDGRGVIDLCQVSEFLVLHEIGHAWTHVNMDAAEQARFAELTGSPSWAAAADAWHKRGTEVAANAIAHGLLSTPLDSPDQRARELGQFTALTGLASPRATAAAEVPPTEATLATDELQHRSAYAAWQASGAGAGE